MKESLQRESSKNERMKMKKNENGRSCINIAATLR